MVYTFPSIDHETLANGLHTMWLAYNEQPVIVAALQIETGKFAEQSHEKGIADLVVHTMLKGPASLATSEFAEKIESTGASLYCDVGEEHIIIGCRVLKQFAAEIVPLFWETITSAAFRESDLKQLKRETTAMIQAEFSEPGIIASRHFMKKLWGSGHPASMYPTIDSIKKIDVAAVKLFYDDYISPDKATLIIAGDFLASEAQAQWKGLFASWKSQHSTGLVLKSISAAVVRKAPTIRIVHKPDTTQATLIIGHGMVGEMHPLHNHISLVNYILGSGNFSSRLMTHIRSNEGKTYGISSHVSCFKDAGTFTISTSTKNDQLVSILDSILSVFGEFCVSGVTQEELSKAGTYALGNMAFQLESLDDIVEKLLWLRFYNRPVSYLELFDETIHSMSLHDVNSAISGHFSKQGLVFTVVGNTKELPDGLEKYGELEECNFREQP